jgi:hypothetical protein
MSNSKKSKVSFNGIDMNKVCVYDSRDNLELYHYDYHVNDGDFEKNVRGWIYDKEAKRLVAKGLAQFKVIITDAVTENDGKLFYEGYEGVVVRVYRNKGTTYISTNKKIDCSKSRWGKSKYFKDMYLSLGGKMGTLFVSETFEESEIPDTSPFCYLFLVVHPDLALVSKQDIGEGKIIYIDTFKMWDTDKEPPMKFERSNEVDLARANEILKNGGFLVSEDRTKIFRSKAYQEALDIRGNNPCLFNTLVTRIHDYRRNNVENAADKAYEDLERILPNHCKEKLKKSMEKYKNIGSILHEWLQEAAEDEYEFQTSPYYNYDIYQLMDMSLEEFQKYLDKNYEILLKLYSKLKTYKVRSEKGYTGDCPKIVPSHRKYNKYD